MADIQTSILGAQCRISGQTDADGNAPYIYTVVGVWVSGTVPWLALVSVTGGTNVIQFTSVEFQVDPPEGEPGYPS